MFVQVIQGPVSDAGEMRAAVTSWLQELAPAATGWLGTLQHQGVDFAFWLGNQGLEFTSMGRVWQYLLFVGLLFWAFLLGRALWPALTKPSTSRTMSSVGRERCLPRISGITQNEQLRLQPSASFTYALRPRVETRRGSLAVTTQSAGLPTSTRSALPLRTCSSLSMSLEPRK